MSNKLAGRGSKDKTRPRSSEKLKKLNAKEQAETATDLDNPPPNGEVEVQHEFREDVKELQIDPTKFKTTIEPKPPSAEKPKKKVMVRKAIPNTELQDNRPKKKVLIARPAEIDTEDTKEISSTTKFDDRLHTSGEEPAHEVIQGHHILGTPKDMWTEANLRGESSKFNIPRGSLLMEGLPVVEGMDIERNLDANNITDNVHIDETKALTNWQKQMNERKKQQEHLSKTMSVPADMLVMNQGDGYRTMQEERSVIDRAMPSMNYGKGYRVGSEFWKQAEPVGQSQEEQGLSITLTQTERGFAPPMEHVSRPEGIRNEMGISWKETRRMTDVHYPWQKSAYREERQKQLGTVIGELDPHNPYVDGLEVIGRKIQLNPSVEYEYFTPLHGDLTPIPYNGEEEEGEDDLMGGTTVNRDPLSAYADVAPALVFGPSLIISGKSAGWTGDEQGPGNEDAGLIARFMFEAAVDEMSNNSIDITNDGTAVIFYHWEKLPALNPFGIQKGRPIQRFYFDSSDGMIMPGQTIQLPLLFKSANSGVFVETWRLDTHPVLLGGARIEVALRGVASKQDEFEEKRKEIERELEQRQHDRMIERIVNEIVAGIGTPPRPGTPEDQYITEEEIFSLQNDQFHYKTDTVDALKVFHQKLEKEEDWDLSVDTLLQDIVAVEDEDSKEEMLEQLNTDVRQLSSEQQSPIPKTAYNTCYQVLCDAVDSFVGDSMKLRAVLGLPEKEFVLKQEEPMKKSKKGLSTHVEIPQAKSRQESRSVKKESPSGVKGTKSEKPQKGKGKDKVESTVPSTARMESLNGTDAPILENEMSDTPDLHDPAYTKYLNRFHIQVHSCLVEMSDKIAAILSCADQDSSIDI